MKLLALGPEEVSFEGFQRVGSLDEKPHAVVFSIASDAAAELDRVQDFCRRNPDIPVLVLAPEVSPAALLGLRARVKKCGAQEAITRSELEPRLLGRVLEHCLERHKLVRELDTWSDHADIAEMANRRATQVLALVSHEIRGRMTVINFMSTLALDGRTREERRQECLRVLKESSESLQSLLNDLLDHSKLLEGELSLSPTDFSLRNLLENTVSGFRILAESKALEVRLEVAPEVPD
ncbi:MAG: histidine kinase dimerization/phospho-acceptor domain-containing protein, partial [Candidatus Eremiobacterota bacterium]